MNQRPNSIHQIRRHWRNNITQYLWTNRHILLKTRWQRPRFHFQISSTFESNQVGTIPLTLFACTGHASFRANRPPVKVTQGQGFIQHGARSGRRPDIGWHYRGMVALWRVRHRFILRSLIADRFADYRIGKGPRSTPQQRWIMALEIQNTRRHDNRRPRVII